MAEKGFRTEFGAEETAQLSKIRKPADAPPGTKDMREMIWCSIDNDDSRDLDQLQVVAQLPNGDVKVYVAIADVDSLVPKDSAIDKSAALNTTSIYTADKIFPMLPEKLSTDLTSLNPDEDRLAMVTEYVVGADGIVKEYDIYPGLVHNHAKLAYNSVAAWLDGKGEMPAPIGKVAGLEENLRLQQTVSDLLKDKRHENGSLTLESLEPKAKMDNGLVRDIVLDEKNCAKEIIENFMVTTNGCTARYLAERGYPTFMRVVKTPEKWDRIVEVAKKLEYKLPSSPDSAALEKFLQVQKAADPLHFPDLSLTIVKLLGSGEYIVQQPGETPVGHFGLAVKDYSHSTAPNRRYPDLITQRILKAAQEGKPCPYTPEELEGLAALCTEQEDEATKVERQVRKSAAALHLSDKVGETFDALVTGSGEKGTWVRVLNPPAEGKLVRGAKDLEVGDKVRVELLKVNVERGFIDFGISKE
ncbi:MAG: RNB domain-containing ribonuclease [Armatimonadetes bacterium]|nr:RNB domain-containing ribonuclease [Armatimonadota bacterium]